MTSDTSSCITIKDDTDDNDSSINDSDDNDVDYNDPNMTMLIETPEVVFSNASESLELQCIFEECFLLVTFPKC